MTTSAEYLDRLFCEFADKANSQIPAYKAWCNALGCQDDRERVYTVLAAIDRRFADIESQVSEHPTMPSETRKAFLNGIPRLKRITQPETLGTKAQEFKQKFEDNRWVLLTLPGYLESEDSLEEYEDVDAEPSLETLIDDLRGYIQGLDASDRVKLVLASKTDELWWMINNASALGSEPMWAFVCSSKREFLKALEKVDTTDPEVHKTWKTFGGIIDRISIWLRRGRKISYDLSHTAENVTNMLPGDSGPGM